MSTKKAKFVISPFRTPVQRDPDYARRTWKALKAAIHEIQLHNAGGLSFEELYRNAYNMVLNKHGEMLYKGLEETVREHMVRMADDIAASRDESFLEVLAKNWANHKVSMVMIRDILMYMDRTYVKITKQVPVYDVGLNLFRDQVVRAPAIKKRLLDTVMGMIQREREGEVISAHLVKAVTSMWWSLGRDVYEEDFQQHYLEWSGEFFNRESQECISRTSCPEYLKVAQQRINEELHRVHHYLHASTEPHIKAVVEQELIKRHMTTLVEMESSGVTTMLRDGRTADLERMYTLFQRVHDGLAVIQRVLAVYLREEGRALVTDVEVQKSPIRLVQSLLELKDKYDVLVRDAFHADRDFVQTVSGAFEHFINLSPTSPEYISLYIDDKLRRGLKGMTEEEVDAILDKCLILFRFLHDKDMFERYYKQHLSKRLLAGNSVSDDAERSLIQKLKTECGYQFTSRAEGMFTDMRLSEDAMEDFKASAVADGGGSDALPIDINVRVLTTGFWPTTAVPACTLPAQVQAAADMFRTFYLGNHTGRRLTWQANLGTAQVKMLCAKKKHELTVSTYQMCVLLRFNAHERTTLATLAEETQIPHDELVRALQSLCASRYRVLLKEPRSREMAPTDTFTVNGKFTNKLFRVKIAQVTQKESRVEKVRTYAKVDEDRKPHIEAAVVRIMKSRKKMEHNLLIAEATKQLSTRFVPNPNDVKKRIESLIEREFLERSEEDRRVYKYLA